MKRDNMKDEQTKQTKGIFIPENILRHKKLFVGAKLLYGDIAFICERDGCCTKRNIYFAKLYGTNVGTISRWVSLLSKYKFIKYRIRHKFIRIIFLSNADAETINKVIDKTIRGAIDKSKGAIDKSKDIHKEYREHSFDAHNNINFEEEDFDFDDEDISNWLDDLNVK